ncbi:MAG: peptidoglycan-binding domain-containing protein [Longicatena caecimuris]|uniref:peptidoglycan-binding domain-containing protein n=1 Tax=Longicatena caecimuris TaxID=1796635 RepID=UPI00399230AB
MAKVIVYDVYSEALEVFDLSENDTMPYVYGDTMRVSEFRGSSRSNVLWTTNAAMESWNATRRSYGAPIPFRYAFKRIWEGGHGRQSQHYAGVSFDVGQALSQTQRNRIWNVAKNLGVWVYVEPISMTPTWVHFDNVMPPLRAVLVIPLPCDKAVPRCVCAHFTRCFKCFGGYSTQTLDGAFGSNTRAALIAYQRNNGLTADGISGCGTWTRLVNEVVGIGRTPTVIDP